MKKIVAISLVVLMLTATYCFAQTDSGMKGPANGGEGSSVCEDGRRDDETKCSIPRLTAGGMDDAFFIARALNVIK